MKRSFRTAAAAMAAALVLSLAACGEAASDNSSDSGAAQTTSAAASQEQTAAEIYNFVAPVEGEEIAVMTIKDYGEIKIKLFPDLVPKAVENFKGLANMNYYDELIFHRIIPDFMNQGGDPRGNGTGGNSMWGGSFDGGIAEGLCHFSGAVAYANSGSTATNGSQFYIVNTPESYVNLGGAENMDVLGISEAAKALYEEKGGTPFLDGGYTVFGQVFEGMDVVRAMAQVETDQNDKPVEQVIIESVRIVEYKPE